MATRMEDSVRLEMELGKKSFGCRGEREMLRTHFDSLPMPGRGTEDAHYWPAGGGCMMCNGGRRKWLMTMKPRAK
jgi:hypothetical protein